MLYIHFYDFYIKFEDDSVYESSNNSFTREYFFENKHGADFLSIGSRLF